jgi:hypothetical protein
MKSWWRGACAVVIAYLALLAVARITAGTYISADDLKQSNFLRTYDPIPFLSSFRVGCQPLNTLVSASAAAGYTRLRGKGTNVRFTRTIQPDLCDTSHSASILTGLQQNLVSALGSAGCEVLWDSLSLDQGIRIYYRCGTRTSGLVTTSPPRSRADDGQPMLKLQIDEQWSVRTSS